MGAGLFHKTAKQHIASPIHAAFKSGASRHRKIGEKAVLVKQNAVEHMEIRKTHHREREPRPDDALTDHAGFRHNWMFTHQIPQCTRRAPRFNTTS